MNAANVNLAIAVIAVGSFLVVAVYLAVVMA